MKYDEFCSVCGSLADSVKTPMNEENTKLHLVLPFLEKNGFPHEGFHCEVQAANGHIDVLVFVNGKPRVAVEAKAVNVQLSKAHEKQLEGYLQSCTAPVGILTNGLEYKFFIRTEKKVDGITKIISRPFLRFSVKEPTRMACSFFSILSSNCGKNDIVHFARKGDVVSRVLDAIGESECRSDVLSVLDKWMSPENSKIIVTTPSENRAFGCLMGMAAVSGFDPNLFTGKDNTGYFAVNFKGNPLCRIFMDDTTDNLDGNGKIDFFRRDLNGVRLTDSRHLPTIMDKFPFSCISDLCRPEISKRLKVDCDWILSLSK